MSSGLQFSRELASTGIKQDPPKPLIPSELADELRALGICFIIAGGYPRDVHFGVEPKDLDICVYNTEPEQLEAAAEWLNRRGWEFTLVDPGEATEASQQEDIDDAEKRLFGVWQDKTSHSKPVDLIHYRCNNWVMVLDQFDCALNSFHCMPGRADAVFYHGSILEDLLDTDKLTFFKEVSPERQSKMLSKFNKLVKKVPDWSPQEDNDEPW